MTLPFRTLLVLLTLAVGLPSSAALSAPPEKAAKSSEGAASPPATEREARGRAELLHETIHVALQVVHHEYYREDEALTIPAAALQPVFREVAQRQKVELRWLAVNAQAMNDDHKPRDEFERQAVAALAAGRDAYEQVEEGRYRRASTITLASDCLKCHAPNRTSNKPLAAALVVGMRIEKP
jgi:hypothetical protein